MNRCIRVIGMLTASGVAIGLVASGVAGESGRGREFASSTFLVQPEGAPATPGWLARFTPATSGTGSPKRISSHTPFAAFAVEPGQSVHPAVPAAGFEAVYDAEVRIATAGRYRFGAEFEGGTGTVRVLGEKMTAPVTLKLEGGAGGAGVWTEWLTLPAGKATVQVSFKRSGDARSRVRAMWEKQGFGKLGFRAEPIPVTSASVPKAAAEMVASATQADRGRVLLGELGCVHCHTLESGGDGHQHVHGGAGGGLDFSSPVIHAPAPSLQELGTRVNPYWITKWIADPQGEKPGSGMPNVLRGKDMGTDATNITHFLYSLSPNYVKEAAATEPAGLELGKALYQSLGCVACHGEEPGAKNVVQPLTAAASKWNPSELSAFLMDPRKAKPSGRMPAMNLSKQEADLLATYLASMFGESNAPKQEFKTEDERVEPGRAAFAARGCANCHVVNDAGGNPIRGGAAPKKLLDLSDGGCLDPKGTPKAPKYVLKEADRAAIKAAIREMKSWAGEKGASAMFAPAPIDRAHLVFDQFSCRECHEVYADGGVRDGVNALFKTIGEADLGEEGRIPPRLNGTGTKLTTSWLHEVLENAGRARPYMAARMPQFGGEHVGFVAEAMGAIEGVWANSDAPEPMPSDERVQAGRLLAGVNGLNCISCHVVGDNAPSGIPGPDITMFASRLRYEWWMDYVHAPARSKPGTRMPAFYENGTGTVTSVFGGDSVKQADAMWAYFNLGQFMPVPEGITKAEGYVMRVGSRPVVMRTFLKDAGSRGIAVGFPESMGGMHFAFDAERVRLVEAWQGTFLNASGAWAGRGGNVTDGQGGVVWNAPKGPAIVIGAKPPETWPARQGEGGAGAGAGAGGLRFGGYRLDEQGVPTFSYRLTTADGATLQVAERFEPTPEKQIKRTFEIAGVPDGQRVWVHVGKGMRENIALENVGGVKTIGANDDVVLEVTPKQAGPVRFAVVITP